MIQCWAASYRCCRVIQTTLGQRSMLPATVATAPITAAGTAINRVHIPDITDIYVACLGDFNDKMRWKYDCHGIVPNV